MAWGGIARRTNSPVKVVEGSRIGSGFIETFLCLLADNTDVDREKGLFCFRRFPDMSIS